MRKIIPFAAIGMGLVVTSSAGEPAPSTPTEPSSACACTRLRIGLSTVPLSSASTPTLNFGGTRRFSIRDNDISVEPREKLGFVGGVKFGYVFGSAYVRPAVEADLFYNGVQADLDARVNGHDTSFNAQADLHSGAFMGNFLLRFSPDRFQPYLGGGIGGYYAERQSVEVKLADRTFDGHGGSNSGFAWQLIGGADYYWTEKFSTFAEYKFLNYEDAGFKGDRVGQHLVVLGVRMHF